MPDTEICVVGLGYIGLPTAAVIARTGAIVIGVDVRQDVVDCINRGEIHIVEPFLEEEVKGAVSRGLLRAVNTPEPADAFMIAVPTPFAENHTPDLSYVRAAVESIASVLKKGNLVILESTSPVGATEQVAQWISELRPDLNIPTGETHSVAPDVNIAYCPERVLPGNVLHELVENDRIIGGITPACSDAAIRVYQRFVKGECIKTNSATAELCKLSENSFRDVNIAFANELSLVAHKHGVNVWELIKLANRHPRVNILSPGPGVGGHCIAVDPWFIVSSAPDEAKIIRTAREVNDAKPEWVIEQVKNIVNRLVSGNNNLQTSDVKIACFGLAFKANIDDLRESPSVKIAEKLAHMYPGKTMIVEPNIQAMPENLAQLGALLVNSEQAFAECDVSVLLVDHTEYAELIPPPGHPFVDTRGLWTR